MSWRERFEARGSALCIGLDPVAKRLPAELGLFDFCAEVIELTAEWAACYKPNVAFFEREGPAGVDAFAQLLALLRERGIPSIADVKRGDIGSTAEAYAAAYFDGPFDTDAVTVNPSLGLDTVQPFVKAAQLHERGVLLLLRTSNPGAPQFQDAWEPGLVEAIRAQPAFGAVVGATHAEVGGRLRAALPGTFFLVPGFGAQGGSDLAPFFDSAGRGAVVSSSRAILFAGEQERSPWQDAVRTAARSAWEAIEEARSK